MSYFQTTIMDDSWTFYVVEDDDDVVIDEGSAAETDFPNKEVHFKKSEINYNTVKHEMFHVYCGYLYLRDTHDISTNDLEEIYAALFEDKAEKILAKSKEVYEKLKELRDNESED